jgi:hypothetical protein
MSIVGSTNSPGDINFVGNANSGGKTISTKKVDTKSVCITNILISGSFCQQSDNTKSVLDL